MVQNPIALKYKQKFSRQAQKMSPDPIDRKRTALRLIDLYIPMIPIFFLLQIEQRIRLELSCIAQAMVVGEGQDYLAVLLTLQTKRDEKSGKRTKELTENAKRWFRFAR